MVIAKEVPVAKYVEVWVERTNKRERKKDTERVGAIKRP
jgi:hypothetical protein